jgi:hypothetical protein
MPRTVTSQRRATPPPPPPPAASMIGRIEQPGTRTHPTQLRERAVGRAERVLAKRGVEDRPGFGKSGMTRMEDAIPATRASPDAIATAAPRRRRRPPVRRTLDPVAEAGPCGGKGGADAAAAAADGRRRRRGWNRSGMLLFIWASHRAAGPGPLYLRVVAPSPSPSLPTRAHGQWLTARFRSRFRRRRHVLVGPCAPSSGARVVRASTHQPRAGGPGARVRGAGPTGVGCWSGDMWGPRRRRGGGSAHAVMRCAVSERTSAWIWALHQPAGRCSGPAADRVRFGLLAVKTSLKFRKEKNQVPKGENFTSYSYK